MRHPAEFFVKYILIRDPGFTDLQVLRSMSEWGFLTPEDGYITSIRAKCTLPANFTLDKLHRPSMKWLRDQGVYEAFFPDDSMEQAWSILIDHQMRQFCEQVLLAKLPIKEAVRKVNAKMNWHLTERGVETFGHYFWNVKLLTFDEWGRFLWNRSAMYERYMDMLMAPPSLAYFHLRIDQTVESKEIIKRVQEIAYFNLEELNAKPGVPIDKVKGISVLGKVCIECHNALSTSDMALKEVLKEFEKFRMVHPELAPPDIKKLAPAGNFSNSGMDDAKIIPMKKE